MKKLLKRAVALISAMAMAATMAVDVSAASAGKRILKNASYKDVIATPTGIFFTNFSDDDFNDDSLSKYVICVTPDGKKTKINIDSNDNIDFESWGTMPYRDWGDYDYEYLSLGCYERGGSTREYIFFGSGKTVRRHYEDRIVFTRSPNEDYWYDKDIVVINNVSTDSYSYGPYSNAVYDVYNRNGKKVLSVPYSALDGADGEYVCLMEYDSDSKIALFADTSVSYGRYWLVKNGKTIATFDDCMEAYLVKNKNGDKAVKVYSVFGSGETYYSATTGNKLKNFKVDNSVGYSTKIYSVKKTNGKYVVYNKKDKKIYSISESKVSDYYVYENSVAIVTKDGNKRGLIIVK